MLLCFCPKHQDPITLITDNMPATFPGFPINRRAQIALELYTTERSYIRGLETIVQVRGNGTCIVNTKGLCVCVCVWRGGGRLSSKGYFIGPCSNLSCFSLTPTPPPRKKKLKTFSGYKMSCPPKRNFYTVKQ